MNEDISTFNKLAFFPTTGHLSLDSPEHRGRLLQTRPRPGSDGLQVSLWRHTWLPQEEPRRESDGDEKNFGKFLFKFQGFFKEFMTCCCEIHGVGNSCVCIRSWKVLQWTNKSMLLNITQSYLTVWLCSLFHLRFTLEDIFDGGSRGRTMVQKVPSSEKLNALRALSLLQPSRRLSCQDAILVPLLKG